MQQRNSTGGYFTPRPTKKYGCGQPNVLAQAFEVLAPGVAKACPEVMGAAKAYVFRPGSPRWRRELGRLLDGCIHKGFAVDRELLLTTLEGLAALRTTHGLDTEAELDAFMQGHKEAFRLPL